MALEVTPLGLEIETLQEIATAIGNDQLANIDAGLSQDDDDPLRQMNVIVSDQISEGVEAIQVSYTAFDIDNAEGVLLDNIGAFKGRPRLLAQNPRALVALTLDAGAIVALGDTVSSNIDNARIWSAVDQVTALAAGVYNITVEAAAKDMSAAPGELTVIPSLPGWVSATNVAGSVPAREYENDSLYRIRLKSQAGAEDGAGTLEGIASEVAEVPGVQSTDYRENTTFTPGVLPALSWQILVDDGGTEDADNDAIAQAIWDNKPPAGRSFGLQFGTGYDKRGRPHVEYFQRIVRLRLASALTVKVLPGWNTSQESAIKQAMADYVNSLKAGQDVIATRLRAAALTVPLTEDVSVFSYGIWPDNLSLSNTSMLIPVDQKARLDPADITLTIVQLTEAVP